MYQFINFPAKDGPRLKSQLIRIGIADPHTIRIFTEEGATVCEIQANVNLQHIGDEICQALAYARECGYAQAQADMRKQLGITK